MTDQELCRDVREELSWDPKVDSAAIDVISINGVVTLHGTVGSVRAKREARRAIERVRGVLAVDDRLEVGIATSDRPADADLRGDVLDALSLDSVVPTSLDAAVLDGIVTLAGPVDWRYQREEAEFVAGNVPGVLRVENHIRLRLGAAGATVSEQAIRKALARDAQLDGGAVDVEISDATVTVSGSVRSWAVHDAAIAAVWSAPGVREVDDLLTIAY
jgi:osmotically-inducible protein OsmY